MSVKFMRRRFNRNDADLVDSESMDLANYKPRDERGDTIPDEVDADQIELDIEGPSSDAQSIES